jgi:hypothetical protein
MAWLLERSGAEHDALSPGQMPALGKRVPVRDRRAFGGTATETAAAKRKGVVAMLEASEKRQLDELGYLVLPGFVPPPMLTELRDRVEALWAQEGAEAGSEFRHEPGARRLANLVDKGAIFAALVSMPKILECMAHVIGPQYKLSSLNARSTNPNHGDSQPWHADTGARSSSIRRRCCDPKRSRRSPRCSVACSRSTMSRTTGSARRRRA